MTDRVQSLTVILDDPIRTDDVQMIMDAICMVRHVREVKLGPIAGIEAYIARQSAAMAIRERIDGILREEAFGQKP